MIPMLKGVGIFIVENPKQNSKEFLCGIRVLIRREAILITLEIIRGHLL
jgi:hypothetical protein